MHCKSINKWRSQWQKFVLLAIAIFYAIFSNHSLALSQSSASDLPTLQVHPLPELLEKWQDKNNSGDYFNRVKSTPLGYLVWSQFPITVYVQQPVSITDSAADKRFQQWVAAVEKAIAQWNEYLPLKIISKSGIADIVILRSQPERKAQLNPDTGLYDIPRAVTAQTNYKFYLQEDSSTVAHKMTVQISSSFTGVSLLATARHELGHALGIWGHSPEESDALYFSQVSDPPQISIRDINTLKKIYQQPTRLGWRIN